MTIANLDAYREIWCVDFEFHPQDGNDGNPPDVVCVVAKEVLSGRVIRLWRDDFGAEAPYPTDASSLIVAYSAQAEISCHLALGWNTPERVLDLLVEQRNLQNGLGQIGGFSLPRTMAFYGLDSISMEDKDEMRNLILGRGPWTDGQRAAILDYCQSDVDALAQLLPLMAPRVDLDRALLRGEYMVAVAEIERNGIPVDVEALNLIERYREAIKDKLIVEIDKNYGCYEGRSFKRKRFEQWTKKHGIPWSTLESGQLSLSDETFRQMERSYPDLVGPLRQLRAFMSETKAIGIQVGSDGRARASLWAFSSKTSRNQPRGFLFGLPAWYRSLIKPAEGHGAAYLDYAQQEFAIAAALSGDRRMREAYQTEDPYLTFAKQAGAVPPDATKETHSKDRDRFKTCALGVLFGLSAEGLARKIGCIPLEARDLLRLHRDTYGTFWRWSEAAVNRAILFRKIHTVFGWTLHTPEDANDRSLANFPMQANGSEMLRIACILITQAGIKICCPVHDALLIEAPLDVLDDHVRRARELMAEASRAVLDGFTVKTDVKVVRYPDRYSDPRGERMWERVMGLIAEVEAAQPKPLAA